MAETCQEIVMALTVAVAAANALKRCREIFFL
jgi:hypothetical protein